MPSLYIHIPFCEKKCLYCSFVVAVGQEHRIDNYLSCLEREASQYKGQSIQSIYIGGGTPTFLNCHQLEHLSSIVKDNFIFKNDIEFTVEANPEGIDSDKGRCLQELGVNRISLGVQTFNDRFLKLLGRCHDAQQAKETYKTLRDVGFSNINVDLMYSFPGQTTKDIRQDVTEVLKLGSEHVSLYTLTVEKNSRFFAQRIREQDNEVQARQYTLVTDLLNAVGLRQYEVSNFARDHFQSVHNLNYWRGGNYIGLGVGAHSHRDGLRSWNIDRFKEYMKRIESKEDPQAGYERLSAPERLREGLLFGLRMNQGVDYKRQEKKCESHLSIEELQFLEDLVQGYFLVREKNIFRATPQGRLVLDEIAARLIRLKVN